MIDLSKAATLKALMAQHGFRTVHRLGQNFLTDAKTLDAIVEYAQLSPDDLVLEIGPGLGTLTQRLAQKAGHVIAIELDERAVRVLQSVLLPAAANVEVIQADAMRIDLKSQLGKHLAEGRKAKVVANLPYYITTPLIMRLLEEDLPLSKVVVMVQKEVAERMVAKPGGKDYGVLSIAVQYHADPHVAVQVPKGAFLPPPDVASAVVVMDIRETPPVQAPRNLFFDTVRAAFGQRRKTLSNALAAGLGRTKGEIEQMLQDLGIDGGRRGETLGLDEFAAIARRLT